MKYLYKILRLFFCPHKYKKILAQGNIVDRGNTAIGRYFDKECSVCGKVKRYNNFA